MICEWGHCCDAQNQLLHGTENIFYWFTYLIFTIWKYRETACVCCKRNRCFDRIHTTHVSTELCRDQTWQEIIRSDRSIPKIFPVSVSLFFCCVCLMDRHFSFFKHICRRMYMSYLLLIFIINFEIAKLTKALSYSGTKKILQLDHVGILCE